MHRAFTVIFACALLTSPAVLAGIGTQAAEPRSPLGTASLDVVDEHDGGPHLDLIEDSLDVGVSPSPLEALYAVMPDPLVWVEESSTGLHYRRTTGAERVANDWPSPTFLVETGSLASLSAGPEAARILIPFGTLTAVEVDLVKVRSRSGDLYAATYAGTDPSLLPPDELSVPTFYYYDARQDGLVAGVDGRITAVDEGGYYGEFILDSIKAIVETNQKWWTIEDIATPDGEPIDPRGVTLVTLKPATEVTIPLPRPDGEFSTLAVTYNYDQMGEIKWCTRYEADWKAKIDTLNNQITAAFNTNNGGTDAHLGRIHDHCWIAPSVAQADDCANIGGCKDSSGHNYPYNADGNTAESLLPDVWADVEHSHLHYTFGTAKVAALVHYDKVYVATFGVTSCGAAASEPEEGFGSSVSAGLPLPSPCLDYIASHEIGHNFRAKHDTTMVGTCTGGGNMINLMGTSEGSGASCRANYFLSAAKSDITSCTQDSTCPRTGSQ